MIIITAGRGSKVLRCRQAHLPSFETSRFAALVASEGMRHEGLGDLVGQWSLSNEANHLDAMRACTGGGRRAGAHHGTAEEGEGAELLDAAAGVGVDGVPSLVELHCHLHSHKYRTRSAPPHPLPARHYAADVCVCTAAASMPLWPRHPYRILLHVDARSMLREWDVGPHSLSPKQTDRQTDTHTQPLPCLHNSNHGSLKHEPLPPVAARRVRLLHQIMIGIVRLLWAMRHHEMTVSGAGMSVPPSVRICNPSASISPPALLVPPFHLGILRAHRLFICHAAVCP